MTPECHFRRKGIDPDGVVAIRVIDLVPAAIAVEQVDVVPAIAEEEIPARTCIQGVVAAIADQLVPTFSSFENVVAAFTSEIVVAGGAGEGIIADAPTIVSPRSDASTVDAAMVAFRFIIRQMCDRGVAEFYVYCYKDTVGLWSTLRISSAGEQAEAK